MENIWHDLEVKGLPMSKKHHKYIPVAEIDSPVWNQENGWGKKRHTVHRWVCRGRRIISVKQAGFDLIDGRKLGTGRARVSDICVKGCDNILISMLPFALDNLF